MDNETIHIFKENRFQTGKILVLMVPCLIFLIVLILFFTFSSYETHRAAANTQTNVLGRND